MHRTGLRCTSVHRFQDRQSLFDRFTEVDVVRQVVGVGSVGMQVYLVLLEGRTGADPLFLQVKQAGRRYMRPTPSPAAMTTTVPG